MRLHTCFGLTCAFASLANVRVAHRLRSIVSDRQSEDLFLAPGDETNTGATDSSSHGLRRFLLAFSPAVSYKSPIFHSRIETVDYQHPLHIVPSSIAPSWQDSPSMSIRQTDTENITNINETLANAVAIIEEVDAARSAAQTISNINDTILNITAAVESQRDAAVESVEAMRTAAEAEVNAAVENVKRTREVAEAEALEKIAEVAVGFTKSGNSLFGFLPAPLFVRRSFEIWTFVAEIAYKMSSAQRSGSREAKTKVGDELCEGLLRLGPTFIKLGQILSTRFDILPYEYVKQLERLQDSVPPFDGKEAYEIVKKEVGSTAFREFNETPIAAASLGQVHLAVTADGRRVAVKVQRPGLKELFDADLFNLKILADLLYRNDNSPDSMLRDWREIFESNARIIYEEIDYQKEARNGKRFAKNFEEYKWMKVPEVYEELSSLRVLTMEYVPGIKISLTKELQRQGFDNAALGKLSGECFMIQLLRHGFFHCDPHPGNIAVDNKGPRGSPRLIYYDFGMTEELSESFRKALVDGFFALYESEPKQLVQALIDGDLLGGKVDRVAVESIARYFLGSFRQRLALDRALPMDREEREQLRMATMQELGNELAAVASDKPFRYPPALPYVMRAFNALEGVGKGLDVNYDISRIAKKYITSLIDLRDGSALLTGWKKIQQRVGWRPKDFASIVQSPRRVTEVYETLAKLESGELQLRVRALELERAMVRNSIMQRASLNAIAACSALNIGTILAVTQSIAVSTFRRLATKLSWLSVLWFGLRTVALVRKFNLLQKGERDGMLNDYIIESKNA